jgi:Rrf2 family iron-sulfur cluster assembly transcriptional regulator
MPINWRTDYALRIMFELAKLGPGRRATVRTLAESSLVPYDYARTIVHELAGSGLLASKRGVGGGVTLARPADQISLLDVFRVTDEPPSLARCTENGDLCPRSSKCPFHVHVWSDLDDLIRGHLASTTLAHALALENAG